MKPYVRSTIMAIYSSASIVLRMTFGGFSSLFHPRVKSFSPPFLAAPRRFTLQISLCLVFFFAVMICPSADSGSITEYELKAVFLYKILKYVQQPQFSQVDPIATESLVGTDARNVGHLKRGTSDVEMCIVGLNPFASHLDRVLNKVNKNQHHRKVSAKYLRRFKAVEVTSCDLVFLSKSERRQLGEVVEQMQEFSILTVSDIEGFAKEDGMIEFVFSNGSIQMEINLLAASKSNLSISANLLEVAKKVYK